MTRQSVLDEVSENLKVYSIRIKGDKKNRADAFYILMNTQQLFSDSLDVFHGIKNSSLKLLEKAEIDFEIVTEGKKANFPAHKK